MNGSKNVPLNISLYLGESKLYQGSVLNDMFNSSSTTSEIGDHEDKEGEELADEDDEYDDGDWEEE